ncbi:hypothetical protein TTRE_0000929501 [Trichuris trichiura]|uniref:DUF5641 domain-containing protein n=1 Tax=Trichuris trichiura TaxID=36087 RepID=A0A077ZKL1_TRITR|nr:hypothetical protein TTRE_0000929501 [Trichuris trichiura]
MTALCYVENLLNGRPLACASLETREVEVLTPHHLLTGRSQPNFPPDVMSHLSLDVESGRRTSGMSVGDVVVLVDSNTPRGSWPLGRISTVYSGKDGVVRSADEALALITTRRSVNKLLLLQAAD